MDDTKIDKETKELLSDEKKLEELVDHEGWLIVRQKYIDAIMDMQSILNIQNASPEAMVIEMKSRALAISVLRDLMADIEGTAEKSKTGVQVIDDKSWIIRQ